VASQDLQATLYRVAEALAALGWDILSARVSVFKNKARGNFYVKGVLGLDPGQAAAMLRNALHAAAAEEE
jgi:UTP:GlnB (protein PII) uridylyltransferase